MRMPVIYLPHGGGPWPWMDGFGGPGAHDALRAYLEGLPATVPAPRAILCVTAHWEAPVVTVGSAAQPGMLYDYAGFPDHTYEIAWPAPGAPDVAARVHALLTEAGLDVADDPDRGLDHGTFVPLAVAWPEADVPVAQLSLVDSLDPRAHLAIGRALAPLRDEGVLIVGSGMSYHNLRRLRDRSPAEHARIFDDWLGAAVVDAEGREEALRRWTDAPSARACHPREEHLLPLMVVTGAAGHDPASLPFRDDVLGVPVSAVRYG